MKRFVLPLLFIVAAGVSVFALPIYQDPNVAWIVSPAGSPGWLTVMNAGDASASFLRIGAASKISVEGEGYLSSWDGSSLTVVLPAAVEPDGHVVTLKLVAADGAIGLVDAAFGDFGLLQVIDGSTLNFLNAGYTPGQGGLLRVEAAAEIGVEGYTSFWASPFLYVVGVPEIASGTALQLLFTGAITQAQFGYFGAAWSAVADGTSAVVTVFNAGAKDATKIVVNSYTYMAEAVEGFDTVLVQAGGAQMVITLVTPLAPGATLTFKLDAAGDQAVHVQSVALY